MFEMKCKNRNKLVFMVLVVEAGLFSCTSWADGNKTTGQLEHEERSTLETFHLNEINSDELSKAVIAGGLEPTSSGGQKEQPATMYEDTTLLESRELQTGRERYVPPVTTQPVLPSNRIYHQYSTTTRER